MRDGNTVLLNVQVLLKKKNSVIIKLKVQEMLRKLIIFTKKLIRKQHPNLT